MTRVLDAHPPRGAVRIPYGSHDSAFGDLWLPEGSGPHPVVAVIHGGYWRARYGLDYMAHLCHALTHHGYAAWSLEYRRVGNAGGGWPGTFLDIARGADALRDLAPLHALDTGRVVALGHSAGGHLALWLAARPRLSDDAPIAGRDPLPVAGVAALAPVADLRLAHEWWLSDGAVVDLLDGSPQQVPERYDLASPAALLPLGVPQSLLHAPDDDSVPFEMSRVYVERATAAGDSARLVATEGGHFALVDPHSDAWPIVLDELDRSFGPTPG